MKKLWENIKANKLRSALIGCCAFLFGFISVSIFNSIGDTYAVSYVCPTGYIETYGTGEYAKCCPANDTGVGSDIIWTYYSYITDSNFEDHSNICFQSEITGISESQCKGDWIKISNVDGCSVPAKNTTLATTPDTKSTYSIVFYPNATLGGTYGAVWTNNGSGYIREGRFVTSCTTEVGKSTCSINSLPTISRTGYVMYGWSPTSDCTSIANLRTPLSLGRSLSMYACWKKIDACYVCGSSQGGAYYWGQFAGNDGCSPKTSYTNRTACLANNPEDVEPQEPSDFYYSNSSSSTESATTIQYYKITYDLDDGKLIDGKEEKTQYVRGDEPVGTPKTNPVKDGHAFVAWEYNGSKFDFSTKLNDIKDELSSITENNVTIYTLTLKATYVEMDTSNLECEDENAILDPATNKCYSVLDPDTTSTYTIYKYSSGSRFCYGADSGTGGIYFHNTVSCPDIGAGTGTSCTAEGKNNSTTGDYANYSKQDPWLSSTTCFIASTCSDSSTSYGDCTVRWDSIIYNEAEAVSKEEDIPVDDFDTSNPSDGDEGTPNDGVGGGSDEEPSNDKTDKEANESPKTGDALIILAWIVGLCALGYTAYYFIKRNREN